MNTFLTRLVSVLLCIVLVLPSALAEDIQVTSPELPDMPDYPSSPNGFSFDDGAYEKWRAGIIAQQRDGSYTEGLAPFLMRSTRSILTGSGDENCIYSPLSLYMTLAMLAETTGGTTRTELLTLLGQADVDSLRLQASDLWNANYRADGAMTRTLATSLWLRDTLPVQPETVETLAQNYYASTYRGQMGSASMNQALQSWLNENTLGLLTEQSQSVTLPSDTAAAIASTVALSARWDDTFFEGNTHYDIFHAPSGDMIVDFMYTSGDDTLYWGDKFMSVYRKFDQSGGMWLILPDEGFTPDDLLADDQALAFITDPAAQCSSRYLKVNLWVPKFDVSSQLELSGCLQELGVTDVFSTQADFSPLTGTEQPIWLSQVRHDARVTIDEEGCKAAAYTVLIMAGSARPQDREEINFALDRPFIFTITGANSLPLFVGVVNQP